MVLEGVESLFIVHFNERFSKINHEAFVHSYLKNINCKHVVAGFDFTYGYKGKGTMSQLKKDGIGLFDVTTVAKVLYQNEKISSTIIRHLLRSGKVDEIPHYLGDNYCVLGKMIDVRLRDNTSVIFLMEISDDYLLPKSGIYDVQLCVMEKVYDGMIYLSKTTAKIFEVIVTGLNRIGDNASAKIKFINRRSDDDKQEMRNKNQLGRAI